MSSPICPSRCREASRAELGMVPVVEVGTVIEMVPEVEVVGPVMSCLVREALSPVVQSAVLDEPGAMAEVKVFPEPQRTMLSVEMFAGALEFIVPMHVGPLKQADPAADDIVNVESIGSVMQVDSAVVKVNVESIGLVMQILASTSRSQQFCNTGLMGSVAPRAASGVTGDEGSGLVPGLMGFACSRLAVVMS